MQKNYRAYGETIKQISGERKKIMKIIDSLFAEKK